MHRDPYAYEMVHRTEHSIEFQAVMLSYLYGSAVHCPYSVRFFGAPWSCHRGCLCRRSRRFSTSVVTWLTQPQVR